MNKISALTLFLVIAITPAASADCRARTYYKPYYYNVVKQVVLYQVGIETRAEAIAEQAAKKAIAQFKVDYDAKMQAALKAAVSGKVCVTFGADGQPNGTVTGNDAQQVLNTNCIRCHQGPGSRGGDKDFRDVSKLDALTRHQIEFKARTGLMPPKGEGEPVSDADAAVLQDWIRGAK